jgi:hypothetical protein
VMKPGALGKIVLVPSKEEGKIKKSLLSASRS